MASEDRNRGFLTEKEAFSARDRKAYQEKFLKEVVEHAYASGTPLRRSMDNLGQIPADINSVEDLQKLPITKKKDLSEAQKSDPPFGGFLTVPVANLAQNSSISRAHLRPGRGGARLLALENSPVFSWIPGRRYSGQHIRIPPHTCRAHVRRGHSGVGRGHRSNRRWKY